MTEDNILPEAKFACAVNGLPLEYTKPEQWGTHMAEIKGNAEDMKMEGFRVRMCLYSPKKDTSLITMDATWKGIAELKRQKLLLCLNDRYYRYD